ncbi:MAG TPA: hypothetical protein DCO86_04405 [Spirochaetaceae bacterium]|nr:hypothetical protein [Spirochaetaceae bacterium]
MAGIGGGGAIPPGAAVAPLNQDAGNAPGHSLYRTSDTRPAFKNWESIPDNFGSTAANSGGTGTTAAKKIHEFAFSVVATYNGGGGSTIFLAKSCRRRAAAIRSEAGSYKRYIIDPTLNKAVDYFGTSPEEDKQAEKGPMLIKGRLKYTDYFIDHKVKVRDPNNESSDLKTVLVRRFYEYETYAIRPANITPDVWRRGWNKDFKPVIEDQYIQKEWDERYTPTVGRVEWENDFKKSRTVGKGADRTEVMTDENKKAKKEQKIMNAAAEKVKHKYGAFSKAINTTWFDDGEIADWGQEKMHTTFSGNAINPDKFIGKGYVQDIDDRYVLFRRRYVTGERIYDAGFGMPFDSGEKFTGEFQEDEQNIFGTGMYDDYPPDKFLRVRVRAAMNGDPMVEGDDIGASKDKDITKLQFRRWILTHRINIEFLTDKMDEQNWFQSLFNLKNRAVKKTGADPGRLGEYLGKPVNRDDKGRDKAYGAENALNGPLAKTIGVFESSCNDGGDVDYRKFPRKDVMMSDIYDAAYDIGGGMFGSYFIFKPVLKYGKSALFNPTAKSDGRIDRAFCSYPCRIFFGVTGDSNVQEVRYWMKAHATDADKYPTTRRAAKADGYTGIEVLDYIHSCLGHLDEHTEKTIAKSDWRFDCYPDWAYDVPCYDSTVYYFDRYRRMYDGECPWIFDLNALPIVLDWRTTVRKWFAKHRVYAQNEKRQDYADMFAKKEKGKIGSFSLITWGDDLDVNNHNKARDNAVKDAQDRKKKAKERLKEAKDPVFDRKPKAHLYKCYSDYLDPASLLDEDLISEDSYMGESSIGLSDGDEDLKPDSISKSAEELYDEII